MSAFEVTRQRMLAAWRWEASRLCQADAQAELASTINAMRSIMLFAAPFATEGAAKTDDGR